MAEVGKKELLVTLHIFQKDKSLGPYRLSIKIFLGCCDFTEENIVG